MYKELKEMLDKMENINNDKRKDCERVNLLEIAREAMNKKENRR